MSLVWDIFDDADIDPTPDDERSHGCEECGVCADLVLVEYRDEFGREFAEWVCGECRERLTGHRAWLALSPMLQEDNRGR